MKKLALLIFVIPLLALAEFRDGVPTSGVTGGGVTAAEIALGIETGTSTNHTLWTETHSVSGSITMLHASVIKKGDGKIAYAPNLGLLKDADGTNAIRLEDRELRDVADQPVATWALPRTFETTSGLTNNVPHPAAASSNNNAATTKWVRDLVGRQNHSGGGIHLWGEQLGKLAQTFSSSVETKTTWTNIGTGYQNVTTSQWTWNHASNYFTFADADLWVTIDTMILVDMVANKMGEWRVATNVVDADFVFMTQDKYAQGNPLIDGHVSFNPNTNDKYIVVFKSVGDTSDVLYPDLTHVNRLVITGHKIIR